MIHAAEGLFSPTPFPLGNGRLWQGGSNLCLKHCHSLKSRKKSGRTEKQNLAQAISAVTNFVLALSGEISG